MTTTRPEAPTSPGRLQVLAQRYRDDLEANTQDSVDQMTRAWVRAQQRISLDIQVLASKLEAARLAGVEPDVAWLIQEQRLANITETILAELRRWIPLAGESVRANAYQAARRARDDARSLAREAARTDLPGVVTTFGDVNPANMASVLGHLADGGPLTDLLAAVAVETVEAAQGALLTGVALGQSVPQIATALTTALDVPRWRAETIARTETLRAYRETSRLTYERSNVVGTWVWTAALDRRTCPACLALHGREFPVSAQLDGHPRCRCAMVPRTKSWGELDPMLVDLPDTRPTIPTGAEWLAAQSPLTQRGILGPGKYAAWKAGDLPLEAMVARTHSPEWGTMRRERSMVEVREGRNADFTDAA